MTDTATIVPGAPVWIDISVTDLERSKRFYAAVLGWEFTDSDPEQYGGYVNATRDGKLVAGMAPPMEGMPEPPHVWSTYLAVTDSQATEKAITAAGGSTIYGSMQLEDLGVMGMYADVTGASFGTWQAGSHTGFEAPGAPGSLAWSEAMVGDFASGKEFYSQVFGWTYQDMSAEGMEYAIFTAPGDPAGMTGGIGRVDEGEAPYWSAVFQVEDTDAAAQRVVDAGGTVTTEPFDFEFGRLAIATGPDGESFALITDPPEDANPGDTTQE